MVVELHSFQILRSIEHITIRSIISCIPLRTQTMPITIVAMSITATNTGTKITIIDDRDESLSESIQQYHYVQ